MFRLVLACLLVLLAGIAWSAEVDKASSVLIVPYGDKDEAGVVADYLEGEIGKRLLDKCVDFASMADLKALHTAEKEGELLGNEADQELLENMANLYNSRYVVTITVLTQPNGQLTSSVQVLDRTTGKTIAESKTPPADGESTLENAPTLAATILQQLASRFQDRCQDRWVGTITTSFRKEHRSQKEQSDPAGSWPGQPAHPTNTSTYAAEDTTMDRITVLMRPQSLGSEGTDRPMAQVMRSYEQRMRRLTTSLTWIKCGPFGVGQPNPMRQADREQSHLIVEQGAATAQEKVIVLLNRDSGQYTIEVRYPSVVKKRHEERRDSNPGNRCQPAPLSTSSDGEEQPLQSTNLVKISGQIDATSPNVLAGQEVTGTLESGETKKKWHLSLVRPEKTQ